MKNIFLIILIVMATKLCAQDLSYSNPGEEYYHELPNPAQTDDKAWAQLKREIYVSYADDNVRYPKEKIPELAVQTNWNVTAWKGEKVHSQILLWTKRNITSVRLHVSNLIDSGERQIDSKSCKARFVRYVMSDNFDGGCSHGPSSEYDSSLVADPIDIIDSIPVAANSVQPIWLSIDVPVNVLVGKYTGTITVDAGKKYVLKISLNVIDKVLPPPAEWKYDFDIWQYPAPIARIHNVALWSNEHFELMRKYFTYLASAGQKVITANIIEQPWGLDHVHFDDPTLIKWIKKKDGSWVYDFSLFEKYVTFMMSCGITQRINCYTMITWDLGFIYFDETSGENRTDTLVPGSASYTAFWQPMIVEFTKFLKSKGWFDKTAIAMDERPVEYMKAVITLLKEVDANWKISLAADSYHPEIEKDIYDYCLASYLDFDSAALTRRKAEGKPSTFYTACVEEYPTGYTFSPPAENTWLAWHAAAKGLTGYLFWAFNTWVPDPLHDARWRRYPAGTLFQFYPGPRTSIRFEKLIEGIQDFEKIRILREKYSKEKKKGCLNKIDNMLKEFQLEKLKTIPAEDMIRKGKVELLKICNCN